MDAINFGFISLEEIHELNHFTSENSQGINKSNPLVSDLLRENNGKKVNGRVKPGRKSAKKKKKKDRRNLDAKVIIDESIKENHEGNTIDESEFSEWTSLRLHPFIMRSIYKLGFKEPTPIQKVCIPAAAHQGKDVVGAAETGSGKTLAFGLPILQRLLEEREKYEYKVLENGEVIKNNGFRGPLRALIVTPTRELALQVTDHLKKVSENTGIKIVAIVGGMSTEKQERLLRARPEIIVGTPGRLWELMNGGECHLVELQFLSFFVLDEADRMIESGHFHELESIIDMLPVTSTSGERWDSDKKLTSDSNFRKKKRQTFVFSATLALSADFRRKLKQRSKKSKMDACKNMNSIESLSERAGLSSNVAVFDLTNTTIMADNLEESFLECREEDKDAHLYYVLSVHGQGRTIVFCTSIAALRRISSILSVLRVPVRTLHAQMQQRARLKAIDRFRDDENGVLLATDVAARGLDIPGIRTVIHYQLPHSAEVYVHRSGRTARASTDGCSIALISPGDRSKFASLCSSFSKENFRRFPLDISYMPEILKRASLARQIDGFLQKGTKENKRKSWMERNAEMAELFVDEEESEEERVNRCKRKRVETHHLTTLQQELRGMLSRPLHPNTFSRRFLAGAGLHVLMQQQLEKMTEKVDVKRKKKTEMIVIGQNCVEPLKALRTAAEQGREICVDLRAVAEKHRNANKLRKERKEERKSEKEKRKNERKRLKKARIANN